MQNYHISIKTILRKISPLPSTMPAVEFQVRVKILSPCVGFVRGAFAGTGAGWTVNLGEVKHTVIPKGGKPSHLAVGVHYSSPGI